MIAGTVPPNEDWKVHRDALLRADAAAVIEEMTVAAMAWAGVSQPPEYQSDSQPPEPPQKRMEDMTLDDYRRGARKVVESDHAGMSV